MFEDADLETTVSMTANSIQWNSGQVCMANSRIYVQDTIAEKYIQLFKEKFGAVYTGDPTDAATNHGPVADDAQFDMVSKYILLLARSQASSF